MTAHLGTDGSPLVVHIIPSPLGRGAQRAARLLVDRLNEPGGVRHQLLGLFDGPPEVALDLALGHPGGSQAAEGFQPRLALRLRSALARLDPAVVVAHGGDPVKYALPAVMGTGRPLAYCVIGTYAGPPTPIHEWLWRRLMARADLVVAVGNEVLDECTRRFAVSTRRAIVIPNGRDPAQFHPRPTPAEADAAAAAAAAPTLIFVGAMTPQKQPDRFVEVVGRLRAKGRSFRALMVGDGPLAGELTGVAAACGIELLGARSDVPDLLRRSDVLVFTSRPTGEGMPGVLIEAGLSGVTAVSTPVPGAASVLADGCTGVIVDDSVGSLVEAVEGLLDDPVRRATMGAAARTRCESEFGLDLMAERWRAALQPMVCGQDGAARRPRTPLGRRAIALRRSMRARRGSSHS
jgi:glycosyltransferase involved in cell wall biosynthesis